MTRFVGTPAALSRSFLCSRDHVRRPDRGRDLVLRAREREEWARRGSPHLRSWAPRRVSSTSRWPLPPALAACDRHFPRRRRGGGRLRGGHCGGRGDRPSYWRSFGLTLHPQRRRRRRRPVRLAVARHGGGGRVGRRTAIAGGGGAPPALVPPTVAAVTRQRRRWLVGRVMERSLLGRRLAGCWSPALLLAPPPC